MKSLDMIAEQCECGVFTWIETYFHICQLHGKVGPGSDNIVVIWIYKSDI